MTREKIVEQLNDINKKIDGGILNNPARIENNEIKIENYLTREGMTEIVALIGDWNYKREVDKMDSLLKSKRLLESELLDTFSDTIKELDKK